MISVVQSEQVQPPPFKKRKTNDDRNNQILNKLGLTEMKRDVKFDSCTFTNCTFNISPCNCNKENY